MANPQSIQDIKLMIIKRDSTYASLDEITQAIQDYVDSEVIEARKDQIMLDFLSLLNDSNEDEIVLIGWRDNQLEELKKGRK